MRLLISLFTALISFSALAHTPPESEALPEIAATPAPPITEEVVSEKPTRDYRAYGIGYSGGFVGLPVMGKHGAALAWNPSKRWRLALAYVSGSYGLSNTFIDIGLAFYY